MERELSGEKVSKGEEASLELRGVRLVGFPRPQLPGHCSTGEEPRAQGRCELSRPDSSCGL